MQLFKRVLAIVLAVVMIIGAVPVVFATEGEENTNPPASEGGEIVTPPEQEEEETILVESVEFVTTKDKFMVGESFGFGAIPSPTDATNVNLDWSSSDTSVATVTETGLVSAVGEGTAKIICTAADEGKASVSHEIKVEGYLTKSLEITVAAINWPVGKSSTFWPVVTPAGASRNFAWSSSDEKVATISETGKLTAVGKGTATITCKTTDGSNLSASCVVSVYPKTESLRITVDTIRWNAGKSSTFAPVIMPKDASRKLSWSTSNSKVATISQEGKLTAVGAGTATITCKTTDGTNLKASCKVIVTGSLTKSLNITVDTIKWPVGRSSTFAPVITPADASKKLTWTTSDPTVATITSSGKLTAVGAGVATITCKTTDGTNLQDTCKVIVGGGVRTETLKITVNTIEWPVGRSSSFWPVIEPENASRNFAWSSSNTKVATISQSGKLTAVGKGTAIITCKTTDGSNLEATCKVIVSGVITTGLKITVDTIKWPAGKSSTFAPVITPANASKKLQWTSSDTSVATVSPEGKLAAIGEGTATITCKTTDGSKLSASCKIIVSGALTQALVIPADTIRWPIGKSSSFWPVVMPENASRKFAWSSSDTKVATVSSTGKLTAVGVGKATITCKTTDGTNISTTCEVIVHEIRAESLDITADVIRWPVGKSSTFAPVVKPASAAKNLEWSSSNPEVATISQTGKLTAVSIGTAVITCSTNDGSNLSDTCTVIVTAPEGKATMKVGDSATLADSLAPANVSADDLEWSSSDTDIVIINDEGFIKAVGEGTATVRCRVKSNDNLSTSCKITVKPSNNEDYEGSGLLGFAWDPEQKCFFSSKNSWQRNFGFCEEYDILAPLTVMYYDTVRVKFRYDNRDWMIQMWKGQYGIFLGCEIGVYYKDIDSTVEFYDCVADEDLLYMDSALYRDGEKLFARKYNKYWWTTGFKTGALKNISDRSELVMNSTVTFHTYEMMEAFLEAFEKKNFHEGKDYWVSGKSVTFTWQYQKDPLKESK